MLSENAVKVKAILYAASIFTDDYIRKHKDDACGCLYYPETGEAEYFLGFAGDLPSNKWTEFIVVGVDVNTGKTRSLDYKLPSGFRMKNPISPVRYA